MFKNQMDEQVEQFVTTQVEGLTTEAIMESLQRIQQVDEGMLSCIDYLMAAAEYQDFVELMLDFREGFETTIESGTAEFMQLLAEGSEDVAQDSDTEESKQ